MSMRMKCLWQHNPLEIPIDAQIERPLLYRNMREMRRCIKPCSEIRKPEINPRAARCYDTPGIADRIICAGLEHLSYFFIAMQRLDPAELIDHIVTACLWLVWADADLSVSPVLEPYAFVG